MAQNEEIPQFFLYSKTVKYSKFHQKVNRKVSVIFKKIITEKYSNLKTEIYSNSKNLNEIISLKIALIYNIKRFKQ